MPTPTEYESDLNAIITVMAVTLGAVAHQSGTLEAVIQDLHTARQKFAASPDTPSKDRFLQALDRMIAVFDQTHRHPLNQRH